MFDAWGQVKTDTDDPRLRTPQGGYRQMKDRALGSITMLVLVALVIAVVAFTS